MKMRTLALPRPPAARAPPPPPLALASSRYPLHHHPLHHLYASPLSHHLPHHLHLDCDIDLEPMSNAAVVLPLKPDPHPHPQQQQFYAMASRSPLENWSHYGMQQQHAYDAPSPPPPPVGQPLLDAHQLSMFDDLFDHVGANMMPSVDPTTLFETEDNAHMYWSGEPAPELQPAPEMSPPQQHGYVTGGGFMGDGSGAVSAPPAMPAPAVDLNPFDGAHGLLQRQDAQNHQPSMAGVLLNFGTDTNFAPNGYHPPAHPVLLDKDNEIRSKVLTALKPDSTVTTAVNSPTEIKYERTGEDTEDDYASSSHLREETNTPSPQPAFAMKRRAEDGDDFGPLKMARKPRPRSTGADTAKSRKKGSTQPRRDNLSEEQKRENHIQSEQKRRNLIRQGFEELCALVPELKTGGYSKSAVLVHAANYLDDLKRGNAQLRLYLGQLEAAAAARAY